MKQNFRVPKLGKLNSSLSGIKLEPNLVVSNNKHFEGAAVERIILKCNHTTIFGDLYYITHTNTV